MLVLGAGGKMGPSLVRRARRAIDRAGLKHKVIAVVRQDRDGLGQLLRSEGIDLLEADLLKADTFNSFPRRETLCSWPAGSLVLRRTRR